MYTEINARYEANDADSIMWFEPATFPDILGVAGGKVFPVGFKTPPGGEIGSPRHVLNDHTYCCQMSAMECADGEPQIADASECLAWHEKRIGTRSSDAKRLGTPLMISEFGACLTDGPCTQEIDQVANVSDEHLVGWAYWQFKYYGDLTTSAGTGSEGFYNWDGSLQDYKVKALARTYAMATQGKLTQQSFDMTSSDFQMEFIADSTINAPTTVYLNN